MPDANTGSARAIDPGSTPAADRRDSLRISVPLLIREAALGGSFEPYAGNLGLGGVFFEALHPPAGDRFEVRFLLPGLPAEVQTRAELLRVTREGERFGAHLRFVDLPLETELAIARFLQA